MCDFGSHTKKFKNDSLNVNVLILWTSICFYLLKCQPPIQWVQKGGCFSGMRLTTHLDVVLRLRVSGAIPLLPIYAFVACLGTTLLFSPYSKKYI
jgi:hypothetical protein